MKSRAILEAEINSQYSERFEKFGPTAKGVFWASNRRQEKRFNLILEEIKKIAQNQSVFEIADIGIVADLFEFIPELISKID